MGGGGGWVYSQLEKGGLLSFQGLCFGRVLACSSGFGCRMFLTVFERRLYSRSYFGYR